MLFIVLFGVLTTFSNYFQATFPLISNKVFKILTPNFTIRFRKMWINFWYQNQSGFEKRMGDDCNVVALLDEG